MWVFEKFLKNKIELEFLTCKKYKNQYEHQTYSLIPSCILEKENKLNKIFANNPGSYKLLYFQCFYQTSIVVDTIFFFCSFEIKIFLLSSNSIQSQKNAHMRIINHVYKFQNLLIFSYLGFIQKYCILEKFIFVFQRYCTTNLNIKMYFKPNTRIQYVDPVYQYPLYRMQYPVTQQLQYTRPNEQIPMKGHETKHTWRRYACPIYLLFFQCVFIVLIGIFGNYNKKLISKNGSTTDVFAYKYDAFVYASEHVYLINSS